MVIRTTRIEAIIQRFISQFTGEIAVAFRETIDAVTSDAVLSDIVAAIEKNDIEAVLRSLSVSRAMMRPVEVAIETGFEATGNLVAGEVARAATSAGGRRFVFRFDVRNIRAEQWLRDKSSELVTRIGEQTREAIRQTLDAGMAAGRNPRSTALDIVGRVNPATGRRQGGIVGLTAGQERWVARAREELASGDPEQLARYLTRERRDARFDAVVRRAIATGRPIPADTQTKMIGRYADSVLQLRGETIARKESIEALNRAQYESFMQATEQGIVKQSNVRKIWDSAGNDGRTRDSHLELDEKSVGLDEAFTSPATGKKMLHPGDTSIGARGEDVINCRCRVRYKVDFLADAIG